MQKKQNCATIFNVPNPPKKISLERFLVRVMEAIFLMYIKIFACKNIAGTIIEVIKTENLLSFINFILNMYWIWKKTDPQFCCKQ